MEFNEATVVMESKVPRPESGREAEVSITRSLPPSLPFSLLLLFAGLHLVAMATGSKRLSREGRLGGDTSSGKPSCAPAGVVLCFPACQQTSPKKHPTKNLQFTSEEGHSSFPHQANRMKIVSFHGRMEALALAEKHGMDAAAKSAGGSINHFLCLCRKEPLNAGISEICRERGKSALQTPRLAVEVCAAGAAEEVTAARRGARRERE